MNVSMWTTYDDSKQLFQRKTHVGSISEVIICFSTMFEVSADLTVIESLTGLGFTVGGGGGLPFAIVINDLRNSTMLSLTIYVYFFGDRKHSFCIKWCTYQQCCRLNATQKYKMSVQ